MTKPDPYGSPYDPRNGGKISRPQSQAEREREQHMLRGCGAPDCPTCNPETAFLGLGGGRSGDGGRTGGRGGEASGSLTAEYLRQAMNDMMRSAWNQPAGFNFTVDDQVSTNRGPPRPPQTYVAARKAVETWIVAAPTQAFDDIVGNEEALGQLKDAIRAPVEHKALYEAYGMKMPKGAMLSGPPGCGKTMFARAAASEMKSLYGEATEFLSISGSELQSMFIGETEQRIKAIFTYAREYKAFRAHPLLVFMDEAEVLLPDRTGRVRRLASWEESQVATFLAEMDGIRESGAFVLLATNRPEVIDQAVLRDGRCDFKIVVQRPTMEALEIILRKNFAGVLIADEAERDNLVFTALECFRDPHKVILEAHLIGIDLSKGKVRDLKNKHFLFEHIVSGAMAASIPNRAKRYAFARDKADGVARGVVMADVVDAVTALFQENRNLDHTFALGEFKRTFFREFGESQEGQSHPPPPLGREAA